MSTLIWVCYQGRTIYLTEQRVTGDEEVSHLSIGECQLLKGETPSTKASSQANTYSMTVAKVISGKSTTVLGR